MKSHAIKRWFRKNIAYFFLAGILITGFLLGLLVGALTFSTNAAYAPNETISPTPVETENAAYYYTTALETPTVIETEAPALFYFNVPLSEELQDYIRDVCEKYNVPCELIYAIIKVESNYKTSVISSTNDYGLMQINKINHEWLSKELGITDFLDPYQNILAGTYIISRELNATDNDIVLALMRYNCGGAGAKRLWEQGIYSTSYTDKVMTAYQSYCQQSEK